MFLYFTFNNILWGGGGRRSRVICSSFKTVIVKSCKMNLYLAKLVYNILIVHINLVGGTEF